MSDLRNVKKKFIRFGGRFSESGTGITFASQEVETAEETETQNIHFAFDCGHQWDPSKVFADRFTGLVVCESCTVRCSNCKKKVFIEAASKALGSEEWFCPDCSSSRFFMSLKNVLFKGLIKRKED